MNLELSQQEERLLRAALNPEATVAVKAWEEWAAEVRLEEAPYSELRMLPPVWAHLNRIAPLLKLPNKLRGKARSTFTQNRLMAHETLPILREMSLHAQVLLTKGIAMCVRFDAWSSRAMGDIDVHVPIATLTKVCEILSQSGWVPHYGMTWASLEHRSSLRRNSWNMAKGHAQLDLHWRIVDGPAEDWFTRNMWESAEPAKLLGHFLLLESPEFAFFTSLNHGFNFGTRADAVQTVIDAASLLPICRRDRLITLLKKAHLGEPLRQVTAMLKRAGLSETVSRIAEDYRDLLEKTNVVACEAQVKEAGSSIKCAVDMNRDNNSSPTYASLEKAVLRRPALYWMWQKLGHRAGIERLLVRLSGPLSKPLAWSGTFKDDYDLRECEVMDQIAGPGWGWPEPGRTCFWSDRADARLLLPLRHIGDHLLVLGLAQTRFDSPNACVNVFANGILLATINCRERLSTSEYCLLVPRWVLFGPWVELSLRPKSYLGDEAVSSSNYFLKRSLPVRRLRVRDMRQMSDFLSGDYVPQLYLTILKGQEPQSTKFVRIRERIEKSPFRNSPQIPSDFDPFLYILSHPDLFEHEVDPYEHFANHGKDEGRLWR